MINDPGNVRAYLEEPAIFLSDLDIKEPNEIIPVLRAALDAGFSGLVIIARAISDEVVGILHTTSRKPERFTTFGVKTPGISLSEQIAYLDDLAILTGGRPYLQVVADHPKNIRPEHFGQARRIWADKNFLGIFGGGGEPAEIRAHVQNLRDRYLQVDDDDILKLTLARLGKLMGGSATLYIGGSSEHEIEQRKEAAEWAMGAVRSALLRGVLPGGGASFLACKPMLDLNAKEASNLERRVSYQVLSRAMEEPSRTILSNAGYDPDVMISRIVNSDGCDGFDVRSGKPSNMLESGILDSAGVLMEAVRGAISSAALALTVDTLVHSKKQKTADRP
jgi:chaperonin GroEL